LAALAAALVLRLLFAFLYWVDKPLTHDEREYLSLASSLAEGRGFTYDEPAPGEAHPERFGRAPLYPFFLSFIARATTPSTLVPAIKIVQAFVGTITVLLVALVANRASGHRAAAWGGWIGALYPPLAWMSSFVLSETLYSLVAFANILLLCPILDDTRDILPQSQGRPGRRLIGTGVVGGLAALTRPAHIFFLALVGMWLLATRRYSWAVLFVFGALITIGPWTMRNYMTY